MIDVVQLRFDYRIRDALTNLTQGERLATSVSG